MPSLPVWISETVYIKYPVFWWFISKRAASNKFAALDFFKKKFDRAGTSIRDRRVISKVQTIVTVRISEAACYVKWPNLSAFHEGNQKKKGLWKKHKISTNYYLVCASTFLESLAQLCSRGLSAFLILFQCKFFNHLKQWFLNFRIFCFWCMLEFAKNSHSHVFGSTELKVMFIVYCPPIF